MDYSYHNVTTLHPLAIAMLAVMSVWMLLSPRRQALLPLLLISCFVSPAQRVVLGGLDFTLTKLLILVGTTRIVLRGELRWPRWNGVDTALFAWVMANGAAYVALRGSFDAVVNRVGFAYDVLGLWLLFRVLVRDWRDVDALIRFVPWLALPVAAVFAIEQSTGHNAFAVFGGVDEITRLREGKLRCQGAFAHPIVAGVFWASLVPLCAAAVRARVLRRPAAAAALAAAVYIVFACASSTPLLGFLVVAGAFAAYPLRRHFGLLRLAAVGLVVLVHFVREKPVWHLMSRIDLSGGSTGYHRFVLIDGAIRHPGEWAALGSTDAEFIAPGFVDITNQYVLEGLRGGLAALLLFALSLFLAFRLVGRTLRGPLPPERRLLVYAFGAALCMHAVCFLAVSYFGQATTIFYLHLALVAALPELTRAAPAVDPAHACRRSHGQIDSGTAASTSAFQ
jgi:hypothetical protein